VHEFRDAEHRRVCAGPQGAPDHYDAVRYGLASAVLVMGLVAAHLWLPNARTRLRDVLPGVVMTLVLWLLGATLYG
jgi:membrane protein